MTLASRLSTQANLGNMVSKKEILHMVIGNIALVQVQATVAAFIVSCFSMAVGAGLKEEFNFDHALLLTASSMFTATSSCFVLGEGESLKSSAVRFVQCKLQLKHKILHSWRASLLSKLSDELTDKNRSQTTTMLSSHGSFTWISAVYDFSLKSFDSTQ